MATPLGTSRWSTHPPELREATFRAIAGLLETRAGIRLGPGKRMMVQGRLARRLRQLGLVDFEEYLELIQGPDGDSERVALTNALTTNLTYFFRESHHFDHLADVVLPELAAGSGSIRIWSAACSTGEEPWSIAMVVSAEKRLAGRDILILATDLDTDVLEQALRGRYAAEAMRRVPEPLRRRFVGDEDPVSMPDALRRLVRFRRLNLQESWPMRRPFQVILCRNVLIYFDVQAKARIVDRMVDALAPGGRLMLGHAETLLQPHPRLILEARSTWRKVA